MSGSREGGQFSRRRPSPPRRPSGNSGVTATGEGSVFSSLRCRERRGTASAAGGGPGGEENGDEGRGDTAMVVGAGVDDLFAENPLLLLFLYFAVSF